MIDFATARIVRSFIRISTVWRPDVCFTVGEYFNR